MELLIAEQRPTVTRATVGLSEKQSPTALGGWLKGYAFGKQGIIGAVEILPFMVDKLAQRFGDFDNCNLFGTVDIVEG